MVLHVVFVYLPFLFVWLCVFGLFVFVLLVWLFCYCWLFCVVVWCSLLSVVVTCCCLFWLYSSVRLVCSLCYLVLGHVFVFFAGVCVVCFV